MREIKFRGMSLNGWVYGHYVVLVDKLGEPVDCIWELGASRGTPVERKSIGQFTGLKDDIGTKIYEGDILRIESDFSLRKDIVVQKVSYNNEGYYSTGEFALFELSDSRKRGEQSFEVIGNIYEPYWRNKHL